MAEASVVPLPYPAPKRGSWTARDFRFHDGATLPELHLAYATVGAPTGEPVLALHGTTGSSATMLTPGFAGELFGPGQPLDAEKYFIVIPDALGHGRSSKPSDGLRLKFPRYTYDDMVAAHYRLLTEGLGIRHLRLVIGNSMGGMHAWLWGVRHPGFMDAIVPMAAQPTAMSGRNWMMRRMIVDAIRNDPEWKNGDYTTQPRSLKLATVYFGIATNGGTLAWQKMAPTREAADRILAERLAAPFDEDANDRLYSWESSRDYDPAPDLHRIRAQVLAIIAADDERNPLETGVTAAAMRKIANARLLAIAASEETRGHGTTGMAKFYREDLRELLQSAPRLGR